MKFFTAVNAITIPGTSVSRTNETIFSKIACPASVSRKNHTSAAIAAPIAMGTHAIAPTAEPITADKPPAAAIAPLIAPTTAVIPAYSAPAPRPAKIGMILSAINLPSGFNAFSYNSNARSRTVNKNPTNAESSSNPNRFSAPVKSPLTRTSQTPFNPLPKSAILPVIVSMTGPAAPSR